jgi:hypothetical protein
MYPITVLQSLSKSQKNILIEKGIIVCTDLVAKPHMLKTVHISPKRIEKVLEEARVLSAQKL